MATAAVEVKMTAARRGANASYTGILMTKATLGTPLEAPAGAITRNTRDSWEEERPKQEETHRSGRKFLQYVALAFYSHIRSIPTDLRNLFFKTSHDKKK